MSDGQGTVRRGTSEAAFAVALRSFSQLGYEGTSVRDVARAVGVKPASLYNHFESKEELLWAVVSAAIAELRQEQVEALAGLSDPWERLRAFVVTHVAWHARNPDKSRVLRIRTHPLTPEHFSLLSEHRASYERQVVEIVEAGVEAGDFSVPEPAFTAWTILQLGVGLADRLAGEPLVAGAVGELCEHQVEMARRMIGARVGAPRGDGAAPAPSR